MTMISAVSRWSLVLATLAAGCADSGSPGAKKDAGSDAKLDSPSETSATDTPVDQAATDSPAGMDMAAADAPASDASAGCDPVAQTCGTGMECEILCTPARLGCQAENGTIAAGSPCGSGLGNCAKGSTCIRNRVDAGADGGDPDAGTAGSTCRKFCNTNADCGAGICQMTTIRCPAMDGVATKICSM